MVSVKTLELPPTNRKELLLEFVEAAKQYEDLGEKCYRAGIYFPAAVMVGAALESALTGMCFAFAGEIWEAGQWPTEKGKHLRRPIQKWSLSRLIGVAQGMQWLSLAPEEGALTVGEVIGFVQDVRNHIHAGRLLFEDRINIDLSGYENQYLAVKGMLGLTVASLSRVTHPNGLDGRRPNSATT